jgi:predicted NBD/HSP70 family sugar kinase
MLAGLAIGPGFMTGVLANSAHEVLAHGLIDVPNPVPIEKNGVAAVRKVIDTLFSKTDLDRKLLLGIGVATGGPLNPATGTVSVKSLIPEWADVKIGDILSKVFGLPVLVENESNCSLLAEAQWGKASFDELTVYFKFDIGVGGAILANGDLVRGWRGQVGEWGHISGDPTGDFCTCGKRGCYGNRIGVLHLLRLAAPVHGKIGIEDALSLAQSGDPTVVAILQDMGRAAGAMIAQVTEPLDPERIIVGGDLTEMGEAFLSPMRRTAIERGVGDCPIELAAAARMIAGVQQRDEPALGAISLLLRQQLAGF